MTRLTPDQIDEAWDSICADAEAGDRSAREYLRTHRKPVRSDPPPPRGSEW